MHIGYAPTSTVDQVAGLEAQLCDLTAAGCKKLFSERVSSVAHRDQLEAALEFVRDGDTLVVTKLDRLARSVADLAKITGRLEERGARLKVLAMDLDTAAPTGKLMLNLRGSIGQFERELMLERQREGIAKARAGGKYKGRVPTARRQSAKVLKLHNSGLKPVEIAPDLGIGRSSVYRIIDDGKSGSGRAGSKTRRKPAPRV
jgi:DNA invertase Pin-like site-specific DNA recombinase